MRLEVIVKLYPRDEYVSYVVDTDAFTQATYRVCDGIHLRVLKEGDKAWYLAAERYENVKENPNPTKVDEDAAT